MNIAVVDIGKPGANFGWAMVGDTTAEGNDIEVCVQTLAAALRNGPLALGFEAPMFVPIRTDPKRLTCARKGDSGKGMPSRAILRKRRCHLTRDWTGGRVLYFKHPASACARGDRYAGLEIGRLSVQDEEPTAGDFFRAEFDYFISNLARIFAHGGNAAAVAVLSEGKAHLTIRVLGSYTVTTVITNARFSMRG
jgi:hypothetical protein